MSNILLPDNIFDFLRWGTVDGMEVGTLIQGATVIGAEPIDYPLTDGVLLYLRDERGHTLVLDIGTDSTEDNSFYIRKATIKQDVIKGE